MQRSSIRGPPRASSDKTPGKAIALEARTADCNPTRVAQNGQHARWRRLL